MKKFSLIALMVMAWGMFSCTQPNQQHAQDVSKTLVEYPIQPGDNLWSLSEVFNKDGVKYKEFTKNNPFLEKRITGSGGNVMSHLKYNQDTILITLEQLALINSPSADSIAKAMAPVKAELSNTDMLFLAMDETGKMIADWYMNGGWKWLLALVVLASILVILSWIRKLRNPKEEEVFDNPETAGPPMIEGGATDQTIAEIIVARNPGCEIGRQFRGRLYAEEAVSQYGDGIPRLVILNGQTGYKVEAIHPNNETTEELTLKWCANDIRQGGGLKGPIRFVPEVEIVDGREVPLTPTITANETITADAVSQAMKAIEKGGSVLMTINGDVKTIEVEKPVILEFFGFIKKNSQEKPVSADVAPGIVHQNGTQETVEKSS